MAKIVDASPAEPTHHQALMPSRYASPAAPTVEPAPMFAASIDEKTSPAPIDRPATKKSLALSNEARRPQPEGDDADGVHDEQQQMNVHRSFDNDFAPYCT